MTIEELKLHISYDRDTGNFTWLKSASGRMMSKPAGSLAQDGYVHISICGDRYPAHHLAWAFVRGVWPVEQIDHKNRVRDDNRIENLREADRSQNQHNRPKLANNSSGIKGVCFKKNRWEASCMVRGNRTYLGRFTTAEEAVATYNDFARRMIGEYFVPAEI